MTIHLLVSQRKFQIALWVYYWFYCIVLKLYSAQASTCAAALGLPNLNYVEGLIYWSRLSHAYIQLLNKTSLCLSKNWPLPILLFIGSCLETQSIFFCRAWWTALAYHPQHYLLCAGQPDNTSIWNKSLKGPASSPQIDIGRHRMTVWRPMTSETHITLDFNNE